MPDLVSTMCEPRWRLKTQPAFSKARRASLPLITGSGGMPLYRQQLNVSRPEFRLDFVLLDLKPCFDSLAHVPQDLFARCALRPAALEGRYVCHKATVFTWLNYNFERHVAFIISASASPGAIDGAE